MRCWTARPALAETHSQELKERSMTFSAPPVPSAELHDLPLLETWSPALSPPPAKAGFTISAAADPEFDSSAQRERLRRLNAEMEFAPYRSQTIALLRRYFRTALEVGRLPALLGRECFRSRVSHRKVCTFEDQIIFTHDLDRCLDRLERQEQGLISLIVFQEYSHEDAGREMRLHRNNVRQNFFRAIDVVTQMLIEGGYIAPQAGHQAAEALVKAPKARLRVARQFTGGSAPDRERTPVGTDASAGIAPRSRQSNDLTKTCQEGKIEKSF
jgi:predicted DNA-binding protein (UPF0251 family)